MLTEIDESATPLRWRRIALWMAPAALVRIALWFPAREMQPVMDERLYLQLGLAWAHFGTYDSGRAPGYPCLVALAIRAFGDASIEALRALQIALGLVAGGATVALAWRLFDRRTARFVAGAWAVYLPLAAFDLLVWPETTFLAVSMVTAVLAFDALRGAGERGADLRLALVGAGAGAMWLLKESAMLVPIALALLVVRAHRERPRTGLARAGLLLAATAAVVSGWTWRNAEVYARFVPVGHSIGTNVHVGINARYVNWDYPTALERAAFPPDSVIRRWFMDGPQPGWQRSDRPHAIDAARENVRRGLVYAARHPGYAIRSRIKRAADLLNPMSFFTRHLYRGLYGPPLDGPGWRRAGVVVGLLLSTAAMTLGWIGFATARVRPFGRALAAAVTISFALPAALLAMSRFRVPFEPYLLIFACAAIARPPAPASLSRRGRAVVLAGLVILVAAWSLNAPGLWRLVVDAAAVEPVR